MQIDDIRIEKICEQITIKIIIFFLEIILCYVPVSIRKNSYMFVESKDFSNIYIPTCMKQKKHT